MAANRVVIVRESLSDQHYGSLCMSAATRRRIVSSIKQAATAIIYRNGPADPTFRGFFFQKPPPKEEVDNGLPG